MLVEQLHHYRITFKPMLNYSLGFDGVKLMFLFLLPFLYSVCKHLMFDASLVIQLIINCIPFDHLFLVFLLYDLL
jgi:hypothetical protein